MNNNETNKRISEGKQMQDFILKFAELQKFEGNWEEDYPYENGNYINNCIRCKNDFLGNKHRVICKTCFDKSN